MSVRLESCPPLSGLEEAALYHDAGEQGFFSLLWLGNGAVASKLPRRASQGRPRVQRSYPLRVMPQIIENLDQNRDTWISQAEFIRPNRRVVYLLRLNLCFVDLDTYKTAWKVYKLSLYRVPTRKSGAGQRTLKEPLDL